MDLDLIKNMILEQKAALDTADLGIRRDLLDEIEQYHALDEHAIVVSGIRRCGKSTLLKQIYHQYFKEQAYFFSFEDERLLGFEAIHFDMLHQAFIELLGMHKTFFLDEIQTVPRWELFVRRMQDSGHKFYLSGSNASLLSGDAGTRLTGRHILLRLFPYSFQEFLRAQHPALLSDAHAHIKSTTQAQLRGALTHYMRFGGMPGYWKYLTPEIVTQVYHDILYRDIIGHHQIREQHALRELGLYLLSNISSISSPAKLQKMLGLGSPNTLKNFFNYFEDAYVFSFLPRFHYALKKQTSAAQKTYCQDTGFVTQLAFQFSDNQGKYLENLVYLELQRRKSELYYYKTEKDLEVDFCVRRGNQISQLIQVACNLYQPETRKREIESLSAAMQETKLKEGLILTISEKETVKLDWGGMIQIQSIVPWLLE